MRGSKAKSRTACAVVACARDKAECPVHARPPMWIDYFLTNLRRIIRFVSLNVVCDGPPTSRNSAEAYSFGRMSPEAAFARSSKVFGGFPEISRFCS